MEASKQLRLDVRPVLASRGSRIALHVIPDDMRRFLKSGLTHDNPKRKEAERMGFWGGKHPAKLKFFEELNEGLIIPRGVDVAKVCQRFQTMLELDDLTTAPAADLGFAGDLRPYQERAVRELLEETQGVLVAPTGSGKSVMGCAIAARLGLRTLVLTHTAELVKQWRANLLKFCGIEAGAIGGGKWREGTMATVASIQTLAKPGKCGDLGEYGLVLVDECHHAPALTWGNVVDQLPARYRYGLSATPWRKDQLTFVLDMAFGGHRAEVTKDEVQAGGSIVPAKVTPIWTHVEVEAEDWHELISKLAADEERNALICDLARRHSVVCPTLVLTDRIEHAEAIAAGSPGAVLLHGQLPRGEREAAMAAVNAGARITVATSGILGEGVDVSGWGALIFALPQGSRSPRVLQAVGRIVRPARGKTEAVVYDLVDNHPHAHGAWRGRRASYRRNDIEVCE